MEHKFCKRQDKRLVKRQDVIYGEITEALRIVNNSHPNSFFCHFLYENSNFPDVFISQSFHVEPQS